jgi:cytochrome b
MGQIILGIIIIAAGVGMVLKTEWLINNFGRMTWFEDKLGTEGGTRLGYKLIGLLAIFIGIIVMTGSGPSFFAWVLSPLIRNNSTTN